VLGAKNTMNNILKIMLLLIIVSMANAQEPFRDYSLNVRETIPEQYKIFWSGGYSRKEKKHVIKNCNYKKLALSRSACYGVCPVYTVEFNIDGKASFHGINNIEKIGRYSGEIFLLEYGKLCYLVDKYLEKYKDIDFGPCIDESEIILSIEFKDDKTLEIYDCGSVGPVELWAIQNTIDGLKDKIKWEKIQ